MAHASLLEPWERKPLSKDCSLWLRRSHIMSTVESTTSNIHCAPVNALSAITCCLLITSRPKASTMVSRLTSQICSYSIDDPLGFHELRWPPYCVCHRVLFRSSNIARDANGNGRRVMSPCDYGHFRRVQNSYHGEFIQILSLRLNRGFSDR